MLYKIRSPKNLFSTKYGFKLVNFFPKRIFFVVSTLEQMFKNIKYCFKTVLIEIIKIDS